VSSSAPSGTQCTMSPNPAAVPGDGAANLGASVNLPDAAANGSFSITISTQDVTGAPSHSVNVSINISQDFQLITYTPSQTINAPGQESGPYNLTIQPVGGAFNAAVTLTCTGGVPAGAQCVFDPPAPQTPGSSVVQVVMNITTTGPNTSPSASKMLSRAMLALGLVPPIALLFSWRRGSRWRRSTLAALTALFLLLPILSCAGVSNGGTGSGGPPTPPGTYVITVTGSSTGAPPDSGQHTTVTLVVN